MSGFKVGDRVLVTGDTQCLSHPFVAGQVGMVVDVEAPDRVARVKVGVAGAPTTSPIIAEIGAWWVGFADLEPTGTPLAAPPAPVADAVSQPAHYLAHPSGVECITITEHMGFCLGNVIKYVWRAGLKSPDALTDLRKARAYLNREIDRLEAASWSAAKPLEDGETL